jgi:hypothetical protein
VTCFIQAANWIITFAGQLHKYLLSKEDILVGLRLQSKEEGKVDETLVSSMNMKHHHWFWLTEEKKIVMPEEDRGHRQANQNHTEHPCSGGRDEGDFPAAGVRCQSMLHCLDTI